MVSKLMKLTTLYIRLQLYVKVPHSPEFGLQLIGHQFKSNLPSILQNCKILIAINLYERHFPINDYEIILMNKSKSGWDFNVIPANSGSLFPSVCY